MRIAAEAFLTEEQTAQLEARAQDRGAPGAAKADCSAGRTGQAGP